MTLPSDKAVAELQEFARHMKGELRSFRTAGAEWLVAVCRGVHWDTNQQLRTPDFRIALGRGGPSSLIRQMFGGLSSSASRSMPGGYIWFDSQDWFSNSPPDFALLSLLPAQTRLLLPANMPVLGLERISEAGIPGSRFLYHDGRTWILEECWIPLRLAPNLSKEL